MPPNTPRPSADPHLPRRQVLSTLVLAGGLAAIFVAGLWIFHGQARRHLDENLGLRLQQVAVTAATTVPGDSLFTWLLAPTPAEPAGLTVLAGRLKRVEIENGLSKIVLYDAQRTVLVDTSRILRRGEPDPFLLLDLPAVEQAGFGLPSTSTLQEVAGEFLKAGYAPVFDSYDEVAGFVGVVGSASYFDTLHNLQRTLWGVGVVTVGLVALGTLGFLGYQRRLVRARAALARHETLASMGRMAAGIAHEIRNPLGIVKNTAQLLKEELADVDGDIDRELLDFIPEEIDRLDQTLTGYLEFARDAPPRPEPTDLVRLLRRTLKVMTPDFRHAGVEAVDNLEQVGQLEAWVDPRRMQQVFLNLFLNAIQAMPDGGRLEVRLGAESGRCILRVADTGVGLEGDGSEVFEPFVTHKEKGSGLGLSLVRQIVEAHGGRVTLEPGTPRGATAVVILPLRKES